MRFCPPKLKVNLPYLDAYSSTYAEVSSRNIFDIKNYVFFDNCCLPSYYSNYITRYSYMPYCYPDFSIVYYPYLISIITFNETTYQIPLIFLPGYILYRDFNFPLCSSDYYNTLNYVGCLDFLYKCNDYDTDTKSMCVQAQIDYGLSSPPSSCLLVSSRICVSIYNRSYSQNYDYSYSQRCYLHAPPITCQIYYESAGLSVVEQSDVSFYAYGYGYYKPNWFFELLYP